MKFSVAAVAVLSTLSGLTAAAPTKVRRQFPSFPSFPSFPGFPGTPGTPGTPSPPTSTCRFIFFCPPSGSPAPPAPTATASPGTPPGTPGPLPGNGPASSYNGGSTANDVKSNTGCRPITVIFARGTSEGGNVGTIAGPPMIKALQSALGSGAVSAQGVDYPASAAGNINQGADGGPTMASLVRQSKSQCPNSRIILSGYSQGAMVVHNALERQGVASSDVAGAVLFGDPLLRQGRVGSLPADRVKQFCARGDAVCEGGGFAITPAHLTYGNNAQEAANFIRGIVA